MYIAPKGVCTSSLTRVTDSLEPCLDIIPIGRRFLRGNEQTPEETPTLTSHTPATPGGMRELILRPLCSAPLPFLLSSLGKLQSRLRLRQLQNKSSASPSSSWRIQQLLLLPLLVPAAAGAGGGGKLQLIPFLNSALLQQFCRFPFPGEPSALTPWPHAWSCIPPPRPDSSARSKG